MPTWIDENLAIAPMPSEDQIPELAKTFKAAVILVEDQELDYDIHQWGKFGVKVKPNTGFWNAWLEREVIEWIIVSSALVCVYDRRLSQRSL
ncbi:MAG: hypothetical protein J7I99_03330 [Methanophagales archaeon]|nr:hypothetical protein [Methanophagales archaeon]